MTSHITPFFSSPFPMFSKYFKAEPQRKIWCAPTCFSSLTSLEFHTEGFCPSSHSPHLPSEHCCTSLFSSQCLATPSSVMPHIPTSQPTPSPGLGPPSSSHSLLLPLSSSHTTNMPGEGWERPDHPKGSSGLIHQLSLLRTKGRRVTSSFRRRFC